MSEENVEIVRVLWKAWLNGDTAPLSVSGGKVVYDHRRDPNGLFAQVDPAVEVHPLTGAMLEGVSYRGHEGMRQWFETWPSIGNRCGSRPTSSWMRKRPSSSLVGYTDAGKEVESQSKPRPPGFSSCETLA